MPTPQALLDARTVFLTLDRESKSQDLDAVAKELQKWGRLALVNAPEKADLILRLEERPGIGVFGLAAYSPRQPDLILWSEQSKLYSGRQFAKTVVKKLRTRIEGDKSK